LNGEMTGEGEKWRRAMLRLTKLHKDQAKVALLDLPEIFSSGSSQGAGVAQVDVTLFEFVDVDRRVLHPAFVIRTAKSGVNAS
jgi:hypothetical protein